MAFGDARMTRKYSVWESINIALTLGMKAFQESRRKVVENLKVIDGALVVITTDGGTENLGSIAGPAGEPGKDGGKGARGEAGKSGKDGQPAIDGRDGPGFDLSSL